MADIDPDTLLEWLTMGTGDERDMQVIALEQLCMLLLMSDNVDRCFESCPPRSFLPALCHIFMDETAPDSILEVTARAITYYLDVSAECSRRIVTVEGAVKALCTRLVVVDISTRTSKDLAEQCVKVLELMCTREAGSIYESGGLNCMLTFIREHGTQIHKDTLHSAISVVARLCSKMEPTDETLEDCMDSLSKLLQHEDNYVADVSLKCFACLADRFTRRGVDPAPLAKHGLTEELLKKLVSSALACNLNASTNLNASMSESRSSSGNVSIIVSVLSMLCRGSPSVTHDLLRSSLPNAIETAMQGDERCVLDTMRLVDLLLILLFEGRDALPKSVLTTTRGTLSRTAKTDGSGEKSHRQLIDCIRSKDTDALVGAVVSTTFDVNFMDDVGQTLLNWASAFGTLEMVEFLCERGSDVNRGQRSSSLHYAACFGRPAVAKVLLKFGANPELRDEDGKTPLDKARERNDEGHKEVVRILQSPGEWMAMAIDNSTAITSTEDKTDDATSKSDKVTDNVQSDDESKIVELAEAVVKGDPEMAQVYVKHLVPIFANTFQGSLLHSVKKATLSILKKMIHYIPSLMMKELFTSNIASQLVEVVALALSSEDDNEGQISAFHCVEDLMSKGGDIFLIHFIRLGVLQRITEMVNDNGDVNPDEIIDGKITQTDDSTKSSSSIIQDATKVLAGHPYHWHDWCIVRGRDCLYLWSDFCAIELSNGSNGWFRFVLDGKLATMYSSGSPEGGSSSAESRSEFLDKLQRARSAVPSNLLSQQMLTTVACKTITVENWTLKCRADNQLAIINTDGQQATVLKEDLPGFLFESNRGTKHTFTAETSLGADFAYSWNGKPGKKFQSKKDQMKQSLTSFARSIYCKYFKDADLTPHGSMATLHNISQVLNASAQSIEDLTDEVQENILKTLEELCSLLQNETMLSSYEIQTSGLVTALNNCLNKSLPTSSSLLLSKEHSFISETFKEIFCRSATEVDGETEKASLSPAMSLVQKLVMVLESSEKLPVLTYEGLGGGSGLQILLRRLRFKLDRDMKSSNFIDRSGRYIKMEPLTTVQEVKKYLLKTVAKQWFDYERDTFRFVKHFNCDNVEPLVFNYVSNFDENGIINWIGTNAKSVSDWTNPARHHIVNVSSSEGRTLPYGKLEDVISRESQAVNCHTNDDKSAWFNIDLGVYVIPTKYTLRHSRGYGRSALRNWLFQVSNDGINWVTLKTHVKDESLNEPGSIASWSIPEEAIVNETKGWHIIRIQQNGANASGQTYYLSISGFEVYGKVTGVMEKLIAAQPTENDSSQRRQRRVYRSQILRHMALGSKDSHDWKLLGEQARAKALLNAKTKDQKADGWVNVAWPQTSANESTKTSSENEFNLKVVDISDPDVQAAMFEVEKKEKNKNNKSKHQSTLDNALRQVVMSFGKQKNKTNNETNKTVNENKSLLVQNTSNTNSNDNEVKTLDSVAGSRIDLANLQFLMAVEDLLDSPSSDLVASALAEAASMHVDQLRLATRSFRSTLLESSKSRPTPSAQGSRESQSPPTELNTPASITLESHTEKENLLQEIKNESAQNENENNNHEEENNVTEPIDDSNLTKEECMSHIQKVISSSMSNVLDNMPSNENNDFATSNENNDFATYNENDDDEFPEDYVDDDENLNIDENNFLNDNHASMEPNVMSLIHSLNDDCCLSDDDEDVVNFTEEISDQIDDNNEFTEVDNIDFTTAQSVDIDDSNFTQDITTENIINLVTELSDATDATFNNKNNTLANNLEHDTIENMVKSLNKNSELKAGTEETDCPTVTEVIVLQDDNMTEIQTEVCSTTATINTIENSLQITEVESESEVVQKNNSLDTTAERISEATLSNILESVLVIDDSASLDEENIEAEILENNFETERLQHELDSIKNEISAMKNEVEKIECHVERMENRVDEITSNLDTFKDETDQLVEEVNVIIEEENEPIDKTENEPIDNGNITNAHTPETSAVVNSTTKTSNLIELTTHDTSLTLVQGNDPAAMIDTIVNKENKPSNQDSTITSTTEESTTDKKMFTLEEILEVGYLENETDENKGTESENVISTPDKIEAKDECADNNITDDAKTKFSLLDSQVSNLLKDDAESVDDMDEDEDDDDDDDDEDFDDIENEDENDEDLYEPHMHVQHERHYDHQRRMWDDNLILKCQHNALVPAFDPRPGRTNIQQTQDIQIPEKDSIPHKSKKSISSDIHLYLKGSPYPGGKEVMIPLDNGDATVFSYVQSLVLHAANAGPNKTDRLRRVWEPTYTIVYKSNEIDRNEDVESAALSETDVIRWSVAYVKEQLGSITLPKSDLINYLQQNIEEDFLKKWKLTGTTKLIRRQRNCSVLTSAYKEFAKIKMEEASKEPLEYKVQPITIKDSVHTSTNDIAPIQQVLDVLKALYRLSEESLAIDETSFNIPNDEFLSKKLTNKLMQQIQDPLALASGSLPLWCEYLVINYPTLFPFETRQMFFRATAFGSSRSIVWLQNIQDANLERARGHPTRRLETTEFRIGRLKHERVTVPRGLDLLDTAVRLMNFHAERKAVLEIEFKEEEGTGLGPSLEFYALIALAIQRNDLLLWVSVDEKDENDHERTEELLTYSRHPNGLFPAPLPQNSEAMERTCEMFSFLGIFLAKCIQDSRLVDIPLSEPFFKMLCAGKGKLSKLSRTLSQTSELTCNSTITDSDDECEPVDNVFDAEATTPPLSPVEKLDSHYFSNVLNDNDFELIHPHKAKFIETLKKYIKKRYEIIDNRNMSREDKLKQLSELMFVTEHGHQCKLEDLGLTFQYVPSSTVYGFEAVELLPNGDDKLLTGENAEEYVQSLIDFTMHKGIAKQLKAFRAGFNRVFPLERLHAFKAHEIRLMLCGEQTPNWSYDELIMYTEPKYGYHKDSPGFIRLINVLTAMTGEERKSFLQFATGCSSLPPGGLANLHPRLTVVKKEDEGDGSYPSVNTCVHYLKLPEYSSEEVLKDRLLAATKEKGFHLN